ncbi:GGDEF domain-containing protein [Bacillus spongiae]|uniref:GGDEF domain-containing protein n=1 Tax=Bacillus spongiae TaxID=2683610 RepID=A0ABU8HEQ5_9BACI
MKSHGRTLVLFFITGFILLFIASRYYDFSSMFAIEVINISLVIAFSLLCILGYLLAYYYDKYRYIANIDVLTKAYNRYYFLKAFEKKKKAEAPFYIKLIDLDDFKRINDRYGHQKGDEVLQTIAKVLLACFQDKGVVARWGGDEFVIITTSEDEHFHEEIDRALQSTFPEELVSLSIGLAEYPYDGASLEQLLKIADKNMYTQKEENKGYVMTK